MEAPDDTTSTADEHKEEERKEGDPPGDIAVEPAAPPSPGGAGRGPEADGGPPKAARGDEVLCVCCNYGTVARCVDCVCGFEQLNYNEENLIYKNVVRLALLVACAFYAYETCGVVEKRFQVYAHAPYWVRYSHIFAEALGDGAKRRQPSAERAGARPAASPDRVGVECLAGHFCPQGSFHRVRCRWYEQCEGPGRVSANKFYAMAAIAGIVFLLAFGTSSVWVSLMAYLHLRRARRHVAPRDDASFAALRASSDGDREASLASRAAPDDGDDYASRRGARSPIGACGFVVRHAKRQAYVLVHAALTACAPAAGARTCLLCSKEGHAAMALLGCAVGLGFGALVVLRRGVLDYDDDGVDDDAAPRHLEAEPPVLGGDLETPLLVTRQPGDDDAAALVAERESAAPRASERDSLASSASRPVRFTIDVDFEDLGLKLRSSGLQVLKGVTGRCASGRVTAIMGPSGAGKTTMLNVLSGRASYGVTTGEDTMHTNLTVGENVEFYGALRLPRHYTAWDVRKVVADAEVLGLEHIEGSVIGDAEKRGISGGQRKRVNVAMEIVSDPSLLFLDEPTTPSFFIFRMFHDVLLCRGGRTAYCGPSEGALPYFEASGFSMPAFENPADFFMDVIAGKAAVRDGASPFSDALADVAGVQDSRKGARQHAAALAELWERHAGESRDTLEDAPHPTTPGRLEPAGRLSRFKDAQTLFFMLNLGVGLTASLASLRVFGSDRAVFWREAAPGSGMELDRFAYFLAKNAVEVPRLAVFATLTLATFARYAHIEVVLKIWFPHRFAVSGFACALSIAQDPMASQLSMVMLVLVFVLFCGISPKLSQIDNMGPAAQRAPARAVSRSRGLAPGPRRYASALSYGRWYVEGLYTSQTRQLSDAWKMRVFPAPR
ncbi:ATPase [Aureococcus anophagefferens]|nr:ATPase [Aureococcus anophagefferens]